MVWRSTFPPGPVCMAMFVVVVVVVLREVEWHGGVWHMCHLIFWGIVSVGVSTGMRNVELWAKRDGESSLGD